MPAGLEHFRNRCPRSLGSSKGFTLVEVVVALSILSLLLLATVSALRTFANTQVSLDKMTARVDEIRSVSSFLRDSLGAALGGGGSGGGLGFGGVNTDQGFFEGTASEVQWEASMLFGESSGGTYLIRVVREQEQLLLQWQRPPFSGELANWEGKPSRVLVEQLQEFEISYHNAKGKSWLDHWEGSGSPDRIRMTIKSGNRYWPDLIMSVHQ